MEAGEGGGFRIIGGDDALRADAASRGHAGSASAHCGRRDAEAGFSHSPYLAYSEIHLVSACLACKQND
jgi:hypothetical protein